MPNLYYILKDLKLLYMLASAIHFCVQNDKILLLSC